MAQLSRIVIPNQPLHIIHRDNNRQNIFESEEDMIRIKGDIALSLSKAGCYLHATNHLHLLITPMVETEKVTGTIIKLTDPLIAIRPADFKMNKDEIWGQEMTH